MTLDQFQQEYPEFRTAGPGMLQRYLTQGALHVSAAVLGDCYDQAHGLKTADLLARSPSGRAARLVAKDGTTTYGLAFKELIRSRIPGFSVV